MLVELTEDEDSVELPQPVKKSDSAIAVVKTILVPVNFMVVPFLVRMNILELVMTNLIKEYYNLTCEMSSIF